MYIKEITEVDKLIFSENPPKKPNYKKAEKMFGDEWKDLLLPEPPKKVLLDKLWTNSKKLHIDNLC